MSRVSQAHHAFRAPEKQRVQSTKWRLELALAEAKRVASLVKRWKQLVRSSVPFEGGSSFGT